MPKVSITNRKTWKTSLIVPALVAGLIASGFVFANRDQSAKQPTTSPPKPLKKVEKTEEEWKQSLSAEQFHILRKAGTERPNGPVYHEFKKHGGGTYHCVGCDAVLFSSKERFDSHCGWPSFFDPAKLESVKTSVDYYLGYPRTEVLCATCDGHLGHVFTGEGFDTPTDKRYCINGTILKFVPFSDEATYGTEAADSE